MKLLALTFIITVFLTGCQLAPTKTFTQQEYDTQLLEAKTGRPLKLSSETVILDVRASFDYSMSHFQGAIQLDPDEFYTKTGQLIPDLFNEARRLARKGLEPSTPVVVVGNGAGAEGKEGRMAFVLLYLGFKDVQVAHMRALNLKYTQDMPMALKNKPIWKPKLQEGLVISNEQIKDLIKSKKKVTFIDVRTKNEYFRAQRQDEKELDVGAIHIPWNEFYTQMGRPNLVMVKKLKEIGVDQNAQIIVLSNKGQRSASVTFSLLSMGFSKAVNAVDGFQTLLQ